MKIILNYKENKGIVRALDTKDYLIIIDDLNVMFIDKS
jgi:hypothetical protein